MKILKIIIVVIALNFSSSAFAEISYSQFENGDSYEGNLVNDTMNGYGKYTWFNDSIAVTYEGNWVNNNMHGFGKKIF